MQNVTQTPVALKGKRDPYWLFSRRRWEDFYLLKERRGFKSINLIIIFPLLDFFPVAINFLCTEM